MRTVPANNAFQPTVPALRDRPAAERGRWTPKGSLKVLVAIVLLSLSAAAFAGHPECSSVDSWASNMAFAHLKNEGVTDNAKVIWEQRKVVRLASEKIGEDLYRQVHRITFPQGGGADTIEVITVNDASNEECSMSAVDVYVISKRLGGKR